MDLGNQQAFVATAEKALLDLLYLQAGSDDPVYLKELRHLFYVDAIHNSVIPEQTQTVRINSVTFFIHLPAFPARQGSTERRGTMNDLTFAVETLKQEHKQRLKQIQHDQLAQQMAARDRPINALRNMLGDLLILAGQRLHAYEGKSIHPLKHVDSRLAR